MLRILIVDDHVILRKGIIQILAEGFPSAFIGETGDTGDMIKELEAGHWDVLITDISMPGNNGLDILKAILKIRPDILILILSMHREEQYATRGVEAGAAGYLDKNSAATELVDAVTRILTGEKYLSPLMMEKLARGNNRGRGNEI